MKIKKLLHVIFYIGIFATIVGWGIENATKIEWVLAKIAPDYVNGMSALNTLRQNHDKIITRKHKGFKVILKDWPDIQQINDKNICYIGRTYAVQTWGTEITNDFELVLLDNDKIKLEPFRSYNKLKKVLEENISNTKFIYSLIIFWSGIILTVVYRKIENKQDL